MPLKVLLFKVCHVNLTVEITKGLIHGGPKAIEFNITGIVGDLSAPERNALAVEPININDILAHL